MKKKVTTFGDNKIEKHKFQYPKCPINISKVDDDYYMMVMIIIIAVLYIFPPKMIEYTKFLIKINT